jgi:excisionase family DNA binding protein
VAKKKSAKSPAGHLAAADNQNTLGDTAVPGVPAELQMLRIPEAAKLLALSGRQVWRLIHDGILPVYRPSPGATRIALADVRRHLERCRG